MSEINPKKELIRLYAKQLRLPTIAKYEPIMRHATEDGMGYEDFLCELLANEVAEAQEYHRLSKIEKQLAKIDLLILDELPYLSFNKHHSELLFQVLSERSERASVMITTNLEFSRWVEFFQDTMLTAALVDRLTFRAHILNMNGTSYRFKQQAAAQRG
jgi:DNA replication protein DnaC